MTFLETERLILRNVKPTDAAIIYDYRNNEICARFQRDQVKEYEGICDLIERRKADVLSVDGNGMVAVARKDTDELVGEIIVMPAEGTISLGYTFSYRHHRKGYAFEALSALISFIHERYPEWDFISFTEPENIPSMKLLKKLGYRDMGYIARMDSRVFGKWTTAVTEAEIGEAVEKHLLIELRDRTEEHVRIYFERTQDEEIKAMIPQTADTAEQAIADFEKTRLPGAASFGRTVYADGAYIGDVWCYCIDGEDTPNAMLSYCIFDKAHWNRGAATEAVRLFLKEITGRFGLTTVGAFAYCHNGASLRVLEKNGFEEQEVFTEDGIKSAYYQRNTLDDTEKL